MNNDCSLIFEAYLKNKRVLSEAPIYGMGDMGYTGDIEKAPGGGYGVGKAAAREGKTKADIANNLLAAIKSKLFKPSSNVVDGKEYQLFYPGSKMKFRTDLENLIKTELKLGGTEAKYTARVIDNLLNVVRVDAEGGVNTTPVKVKQAVDAGMKNQAVTGAEHPAGSPLDVAKTSNTYVKNPATRFIREFMPIFVELPDEIKIEKGDVYESPELENEVIEATRRAYDDTKAKDKEFVKDFIDSLKYKNSFTPASEAKEGEGTGEAPMVDEYPEGDDVYTAAKQEFGLRQQPVDKGNFSYGD
jgi:hypothetical protein